MLSPLSCVLSRFLQSCIHPAPSIQPIIPVLPPVKICSLGSDAALWAKVTFLCLRIAPHFCQAAGEHEHHKEDKDGGSPAVKAELHELISPRTTFCSTRVT